MVDFGRKRNGKIWLKLSFSFSCKSTGIFFQALGFAPIKQEHLDELRANLENIDWEFQRKMEKETRHDVMSHVKTFEECCPKVKKAGILHVGATSAFIQDNAVSSSVFRKIFFCYGGSYFFRI